MRFLFWNIHKNESLFSSIASIAEAENIDVLMIAECPENKQLDLLKSLNANNSDIFKYLVPIVNYQKVMVYYRHCKITNKEDKPRISVKELYSPLLQGNITLVICHLHSKINNSDEELSEKAESLRRFIEDIESKLGHQRTICCGDFNMNPFDKGIIKAQGLHAVMEKNIANKKECIIEGEKFFFFYNPMWGFLGDLGRGDVSGTMYYNSGGHINYYWHLYDQVLIRPDMINSFDESDLKIVTSANKLDLLTSNNLVDKSLSDHLPIKFNLKI